jgi:hypothetical protein
VGVEQLVAAGRAALLDGRWDDARAVFETALAHGEVPEALDGLAEIRYPARLAAYHLAFDYVAVHGNVAVARGWLERGRRLAQVAGDCPERGWVELAGALATDDFDKKDRHIAAANEIAKQFSDGDLEFDALAYAGLTAVERGSVDEGMRRIDEAAAAARGGEVKSHTVAREIYCKMLLACEMTLDVRRGQQCARQARPA